MIKKLLLNTILLLVTIPSFAQWTNVQNINGIDYSAERFGRAVSLSADGNLLAVGAYRDGEAYDAWGSLDNSGSVRIYTKNDANEWVETAEITSTEINGTFGYSLNLSADGNTLVVGAPGAGNGEVIDAGSYQYLSSTQAGLVRVFTQDSSGTWSQVGEDIIGENDAEFFGWSVAVSDDGATIIGGAYGYSNETGTARVYKKDATNTWVKSGDFTGTDEEDKTGYSVSISSDGNTIAYGAFQHDTYKGTTRVFNYNGTDWSQTGSDIDGEETYDFSAFSISLSGDGETVLIGAYSHGSDGTVRLYNNIDNVWTKEVQIDAVDNSYERFGYAVSLASNAETFAVGASQSGEYVGTARIYSRTDNTWAQLGDDMVGSADYEYSSSAISLADNGTTLAVGAYAGNYNDGVVRLYEYSDASLSTNDITFDEISYKVQNNSIVVNSNDISIAIYDLLGRTTANNNLNGAYVINFYNQTNGNSTTKKVFIK